MLQNSKGEKIFVVDGKSWIVGERKISMWYDSKCNKTDVVNKSDVDKSVVVDKTDVDKSVVDKINI